MHFSLRISPNSEVKTIISVSKKISKKAVIRNRIKRRIRSILSELKLKPATYLIMAKPGSEKIKGKELENELKSLVVSRLL